jgi:hypothetical protein
VPYRRPEPLGKHHRLDDFQSLRETRLRERSRVSRARSVPAILLARLAVDQEHQ